VGQGAEKRQDCRRAWSCTAPAHGFGTYLLQRTGNIAVVMNTMGHSDVRAAMTYQHPELNVVHDAINSRHILRYTTATVN
jgi:site-specific recombinase XerD